MNYFSPKDAAERYAKGRPAFHSNTIMHIQRSLGIDKKIDKALDVACGTGLSTQALQLIANHITGIDVSDEMLKWAAPSNNISYINASAEELPFGDNEFDLITVASGVHWFDIDRFLAEAHRVLKSKAWLVLYDNYFISEMEEMPAFSRWFPEVYLAKFPSPKRNDAYEWTAQHLIKKQFDFISEEQFQNPVEFTKDKLALYFTTQSNITAAVESGQIDYAEIELWLDKELLQFFPIDNSVRTVQYGNWIKYIQKTD